MTCRRFVRRKDFAKRRGVRLPSALWHPPAARALTEIGSAGFVLLTIDTTPNYTDTQPWPTMKTIWTYKAIYRAADFQTDTLRLTRPGLRLGLRLFRKIHPRKS
jgi:hypothetical protein